ncbi:meiosis specific kinetochore regulator (Meikin) Moa1 [Schizosaccharomyces pombe]|uniref:Monopolar attachment protein 1 n=1 Tax=Schizosaccharomyces pombe (strain 972 / ATCC 24843) TaxID=284812 RepID=MOA1_SCHPO|nr:protein Moa1 [Schizosaccharomyces pombe]Q9UTI4.1 RecName: Full=Monopolar attachment protein 1; AltName: Full=Meiotically up-regulated gene 159 protein [Schizosaccharomyces pombe 972h-]BAE46564.1 kinetochore protein Moa1 [Schizosaccharomyces pombe]CAB52426.1 meiotic cohesin complex associated protein Moa1 [Schizosaccharomyces pombe]|eukprot:NP_594308.1 protein Moa1 [Schizosaccharomyces pombe]
MAINNENELEYKLIKKNKNPKISNSKKKNSTRPALQDKTNQTLPIHQNQAFSNILPSDFSIIKTPETKTADDFPVNGYEGLNILKFDLELFYKLKPVATSTPKSCMRTGSNLFLNETVKHVPDERLVSNIKNTQTKDSITRDSAYYHRKTMTESIIKTLAAFDAEVDEIILF